jgi:hypothetical protein
MSRQFRITKRHLKSMKEPNYEQNDNRGVQLVYSLTDEGLLN